MQDRLLALGRAEQAARAAPVDLALFARDRAAADRALAAEARIQVERLRRIGRAALEDDADDLGDHVAGAPHDHGVADPHVLAPHLLVVVQGRVADRRAADEHRLELRDRRQLAGAADLHVDVAHRGQLLLRRVLVGDGPARLARLEAESSSAARGRRACRRRRRCRTAARRAARRSPGDSATRPAAPCSTRLSSLTGRPIFFSAPSRPCCVPGTSQPIDLAEPVGEEAQRTLRGLAGVELAHHAGGGVARVHEGLLALRAAGDQLALALVQRLEIVAPHEDLAAHLDRLRRDSRCAAQPLRHAGDHAHGVGHVLAGLAVASRGGLHQRAAFVTKVDRQAVELEFGVVGQRRRVVGQHERLAHARIELLGAGRAWCRSRCGSTASAHDVAPMQGPRAPRRSRAGSASPGVSSSGCSASIDLQLLEQLVVLGVRDLRLVVDVVRLGVPLQLRPQRRGAVGRIAGRAAADGFTGSAPPRQRRTPLS